MLMSVYESKATGKKAFNFQLPDINGNIRTLSEFAGKTLVFHFWFTNCGGCIELSKNLSPIIDKYKNDPKIVFINVCVDKNIASWKSSIKSGIYSHTGEVLLYTAGLGADHPFLKYYKFISFPSMLIVDRFGNLVTANPIRPIDKASAFQFEKLIRDQ
jgi:peroxiredoxin